MSLLKKFNNMFESEEDIEEIEENKEEYNEVKKEPVGVKKIPNKSDVILLEPLVFEDSKDIVDDIKGKKVVILNLTKLDLETSDRLLDFISGGIYALDAQLKTIGEDIYLCVPNGVNVSGEFSEGEY